MAWINSAIIWIENLPWTEITFSEWIQIFIGILSLAATIVVSILIYWMQSRHERDMEKRLAEQRNADLVNQADCFLMENEGERQYLPWCVLASRLHKSVRHTRLIYNEFCRRPVELQIVIMERAGYSSRGLTENLDIWHWFELLKTDIETYQLGRDVLYDNAKYFFRGFHRYRDSTWDLSSKEPLYDPINGKNSMLNLFRRKGKVFILEYIDEYFFYYLNAPEGSDIDSLPIPPIDYVWNSQNLATCREKDVCKWVMELVADICTIIHNTNTHNLHTDPLLFDYTGAEPQTFEDQYYHAIQWLSFAYANVDP